MFFCTNPFVPDPLAVCNPIPLYMIGGKAERKSSLDFAARDISRDKTVFARDQVLGSRAPCHVL